MPETQLLTTMLDRGIVIGLFVVTFVLAIYKGIPAAVSVARETLDKINAEHTHQIRMLTEAFQNALAENRDKFLEQLEHQHNEQKKHHEEHGKILGDVAKKLEDCERYLKAPKNGRSK